MSLPSDFFPYPIPLAIIAGIADIVYLYAAFLAVSTRSKLNSPDHQLLAIWTAVIAVSLPVGFTAIAADDTGTASLLPFVDHARCGVAYCWDIAVYQTLIPVTAVVLLLGSIVIILYRIGTKDRTLRRYSIWLGVMLLFLIPLSYINLGMS